MTCSKHTLRVRFASPETASEAGLAYEVVAAREVTETIERNAVIEYDRNRYAHLASRAPGAVHEVTVDLGDRVRSGDVLAAVDSMALGAAKAEHLQALALVRLWEKNHEREKGLLERRIASEREVLEAETRLVESRIALSRAEQGLRNLGLGDAQIREAAETQDTSSHLPVVAPFSGMVVERSAVAGEVVDSRKHLFAIADTSRMWAMVDIYERDVTTVRVGQPVVLEVEGLPGERHGGEVTWVSAHVDPRTRTLEARAELSNPDGLLRDGMFGKAIIRLREDEPVIVVPKSAVQWEGCCNMVFVRKSDVLFEPRKVRLGRETESYYAVEEGLSAGEVIVTTGSFLLKTEILKGSIGAGCCEVEPGKS